MKIFKTVRNHKGFTLIELAIVLVIIGIILGAVLKGQDLIENARYKKLTTQVKQWETITWTYLDRKGYFPGDSDKDGDIKGDVKGDLDASGLSNTPTTNQLSLGSSVFYLFLGNATTKKNIIGVCAQADCTGTLGDSYTFAENLDLSIDGTIDEGVGLVRNATAVTATSATWNISAATVDTVSGPWTSAAKAILYYFDKKP